MKTNQMKGENLRSELFRFVNVRPPGEASDKDDPAFIHYDVQRYDEVEDRLYTSLCNLTKLHPKEAKYQLEDILRTYQGSGSHLTSSAGIDSAYNGFRDFYRWSAGVKTETRSTVTNKLQSFTGKSAADITGDIQSHSLAWDNYFYYLVSGTNPQTLQALTDVLRVFAIAERLQNSSGDSINSLEVATVVLPECIAAVISLTGLEFAEPVPDKSPARPEKMDMHGRQTVYEGPVEDMFYTLDYLNQKRGSLLQSGMTEEQIETAQAGEITINAKLWKSLGDRIKSVLSAGGFGADNGTISDMITYVDQAISERYRKYFHSLEVSGKYFLVGSSVVAEKSLKPSEAGHAGSPADNSGQEESFDFSQMYGGFWSTHAQKEALMDIQVGDFKRVEHEVECYVAGEVAHIENVLQGEVKERTTRRLLKTEDTSYYETETTEEEERDVQTTDRFEMEKEVDQVIKTDTTITAGVDVSASYGVVNMNANAGFSTRITTDNATRSAVEYAKSITEKARHHVIQRSKTTRTSTIIREFEDNNFHRLNNEGVDGNVVGIYRWIDKIYQARLLNYGKRMMIKFHIIEPSRYYKYAVSSDPGAEIVMPLSPTQVAAHAASDSDPGNDSLAVLSSFRDINRYNYALWAAAYGASVSLPPKEMIRIGTTINDTAVAGSQGSGGATNTSYRIVTGEKTNLVVPVNYNAKLAFVRASFSQEGPTKTPGNIYAGNPNATVFISNQRVQFESEHNNNAAGNRGNLEVRTVRFQSDQDRNLPVTYKVDRSDVFYANIVVECELTDEAYQNWQKECYEAIMTAYRTKLEEAEYRKSQLTATAGIRIKGQNPLANKEVIATELKKHCIENFRLYTQPLLAHRLSDIPSYIQQQSDGAPSVDYVNYFDYLKQGRYANAIEEYFDWENMTYHLYDYFWGDHNRWVSMLGQEDSDPLFQNFLKAGSSTVVVPVRAGYEKLFAYHLKTGKVWQGGDVPLAEDVRQYLTDQFRDRDINEEPECEASWKYKLPTDLVALQKQDGGLDETGLPCFDLPGCD
ncbi:MAG: hypothetical protein WBB45_12480 [Cyclobacteriaceae bacterium]